MEMVHQTDTKKIIEHTDKVKPSLDALESLYTSHQTLQNARHEIKTKIRETLRNIKLPDTNASLRIQEKQVDEFVASLNAALLSINHLVDPSIKETCINHCYGIADLAYMIPRVNQPYLKSLLEKKYNVKMPSSEKELTTFITNYL